MSRWPLLVSVIGCLSLACVGFAPGCGGSKGESGFGSSGGGSGGGSGSGSGGASSGSGGCGLAGCGDGGVEPQDATTGCTNLQCQVHSCSGSTTGTTLTGTVLDPAGRNPLYNVVVYVPNSTGGQLDAIPIGVGANSCSCDALFSGDPIAYALTDTK